LAINRWGGMFRQSPKHATPAIDGQARETCFGDIAAGDGSPQLLRKMIRNPLGNLH